MVRCVACTDRTCIDAYWWFAVSHLPQAMACPHTHTHTRVVRCRASSRPRPSLTPSPPCRSSGIVGRVAYTSLCTVRVAQTRLCCLSVAAPPYAGNMANGQRDVNVPLSLVPLGDSLLVALEHFLKTVGFRPKRMPKKDGNHLCDWWLYCTLRDAAPTQSQVVFGITKFQKVNKVTHLYCRGKD